MHSMGSALAEVIILVWVITSITAVFASQIRLVSTTMVPMQGTPELWKGRCVCSVIRS